jgi:hypothetical protein
MTLPDDVRRFVVSSVPSVPYLEAALLFHSRPRQALDAAAAAKALYIGERPAADLLQALHTARLIAPAEDGSGFVYAPADDGVARTMDRLAQAYAQDLIAITHLIHDATQKNAHRFADAFKLRKDS